MTQEKLPHRKELCLQSDLSIYSITSTQMTMLSIIQHSLFLPVLENFMIGIKRRHILRRMIFRES